MKYGVIRICMYVKCLCIIQSKAVRLICNADRLANTNELFKKLYILKLPELFQYNISILMFNLFHETLPIQLQNRFTIYYTTRSTRRINTIQYNTIQCNTIQYNTIQYNIVYFQHRTQLYDNSNVYPTLGWLERGWTEE